MKILFLDTPSFAKEDIIDAFEAQQVTCDMFTNENYHDRFNPDFDRAFNAAIESETYDFVFSINYFPILSACCNRHNIRYVSYIYDSPLVALYSYTLINPCNYVFTFDKATYLEFHNAGIKTVHYLPLAANVKRLDALISSSKDTSRFYSDVSFVGSLYNEEHNFLDRMTDMPSYTKGYLDGIMAMQQHVYGDFFVESLLNEQILGDMSASLEYTPQPDGVESPAYVYANYFLARKITANERQELLSAVSQHYPLKLYSPRPAATLSNTQYMGTVDYYNEMPLVFYNSSINLNITLKSIKTGMPLRALDILGASGFLLTNFQEDFLDYFTPNEDFCYYESRDDLLKKIAYFLSHDSDRRQIIANASGKMHEYHTFEHRIHAILNTLN